jgi:hypothetical protein
MLFATQSFRLLRLGVQRYANLFNLQTFTEISVSGWGGGSVGKGAGCCLSRFGSAKVRFFFEPAKKIFKRS